MIWKRLLDLKRHGKTPLLTTDYMDEAQRLCDEIIVIDHGQILDRGTPQELIDRHVRVMCPRRESPYPRAGAMAGGSTRTSAMRSSTTSMRRRLHRGAAGGRRRLASPGEPRGRVLAPDRPPAARELMEQNLAIARILSP